jgi:hypothetical protein
MTIRRTGDDAVIPTTREVGLDETYQINLIALTSIYSLQSTQDFVVKEQLVAVLYRPSPGAKGRFRANGSHQSQSSGLPKQGFTSKGSCLLQYLKLR